MSETNEICENCETHIEGTVIHTGDDYALCTDCYQDIKDDMEPIMTEGLEVFQ